MFRFIESVVAATVCATASAAPQLVSRHGPWNGLFILWRVASVTKPKFYAFYSIDGAYVVLAPNGNNLPEG